ncbi:tetratricopeptide repeat-containing sensor histidine kinase [Seonamhaeicola marinus]|uniref:Tetratricopeptide repeat protein n=1 Tax=Seonamhaeicola marinus TaxID=1912246 RepID=A0A5D0IKI2_9FLAO|nr:tetratricopeptide repeat protein [Seonamhaeicola marinus]TYA84413.1 tetratricopeptide repeat protein [Seonamhaeicola marinus]
MKIISTAITLFLLIFTNIVISQNSKIDSLKIELQNHKENDTIRVNLLNTLAFFHFTNNIPKSIEYLEEANEIAKVIHFEKGKARSIYIKGITEAVQSNYDQALNYYNEALIIYKNIDFTKGIADSFNAIGITYKNKGELRTAATYFKKAIEINEEIGSNNLSASLLNLGTTYSDMGDFDEAILYLKKALSIAKVEKNEQRIAYSLNNLGTIYNIQGNTPLALEHFNKSLTIHKKLGDSISIAHNFKNMGYTYNIQKNNEKAISYFKKSLGIYQRINNKHRISATLSDIGNIHEESGNYQKALKYYIDALRISKEVGANSETTYILNNIGGIYLLSKDYTNSNQYFKKAKKISLEKGNKETLCGAYIGLARIDINQRNYDAALGNALKAKEISEKSGFLEYQKQTLEALSKIYKKTGYYEKALKSYELYKTLNDSLFSKKNVEKIAQIEAEYKYKQAIDSANIRELELTKQVTTTSRDLEKSKQKYLWAIIGFLTVSIILGSTIFFQKFRTIKAKNQTIVTEQKLLRSQMTPHFIFNSLSVLQGMILNKEDKKSVNYLLKFSKLIRITLENSRDKLVLLSQELLAVENYLALQNLENASYQYNITVTDAINTSAFKIPPMLIQPFVENAIEHAFNETISTKQIDISINYSKEDLICTIADNGIGINAQKTSKVAEKSSMSTLITSERLQILSKDLKVNGSITIEDRTEYNSQGTLVTLIIPHKIIQS